MPNDRNANAPCNQTLDQANALIHRGELSKALSLCESVLDANPRGGSANGRVRQIVSRFELLDEVYEIYVREMGLDPRSIAPKNVLDHVLSEHRNFLSRNKAKQQKSPLSPARSTRSKAVRLYARGRWRQSLRWYLEAVPRSLAQLTFEPKLVGEAFQGFNLYRAGSNFFAVSDRHQTVRYFDGTAYSIPEKSEGSIWLRAAETIFRPLYFNLATPLFHFIRHIYRITLRRIIRKVLLGLTGLKIFLAEYYGDHPIGRKVPSVAASTLRKLKKEIEGERDAANRRD